MLPDNVHLEHDHLPGIIQLIRSLSSLEQPQQEFQKVLRQLGIYKELKVSVGMHGQIPNMRVHDHWKHQLPRCSSIRCQAACGRLSVESMASCWGEALETGTRTAHVPIHIIEAGSNFLSLG
jgi:hypothetical protein